jgi:hypothetical protein
MKFAIMSFHRDLLCVDRAELAKFGLFYKNLGHFIFKRLSGALELVGGKNGCIVI